jgi:DNA-binding MarR family transcriptional regulator
MDATVDRVELVRDFNRFYASRLGMLTDRYLGRDRPLSEARLIFEIGDRVDVRELRRRLGLDSGYLSRLLRSLAAQDLVRVSVHPDDSRARVVALTDAGVRELAEINARSRAGISELMTQLTVDEQKQLLDAQRQIRRLLRLAGVTVDRVADDADVARWCLAAYAAELAIRFPEGYQRSALAKPGELDGEDGALLVAREDDRAIGCVGWHRLGSATAEIRHLWVSEPARGLGLGRRLLREVEGDAATRGITTLRLGTHRVLTEAIALYRAGGYREIPTYDDSPYNQLAFEKQL